MSKYLVTVAFEIEVPEEHEEHIRSEDSLRFYLEAYSYVSITAKIDGEDGYIDLIDKVLDWNDIALGIKEIDWENSK